MPLRHLVVERQWILRAGWPAGEEIQAGSQVFAKEVSREQPWGNSPSRVDFRREAAQQEGSAEGDPVFRDPTRE